MTTCGNDVLDRAIAEKLTAELALPAEPTRLWQIRLIAPADDETGIWVQPLDEKDHDLDEFIFGGEEVKVAVNHDRRRHVFGSHILQRNRHHWLTETIMVETLLLGAPGEVMLEERRRHPRASVPDARHVLAQIVCPTALAPLQVKPWDISLGGVSFLCPREPTILALKRDHRVEFVVAFGSRKIAGRAHVRFSKMLSTRIIKVGLEFDANSMSPAAEENLRYLLADLERLDRLRGRGSTSGR